MLDNGKPPLRILAFQSLQNFPIRAGILMDTSQSMGGNLPSDRAISIKYAQQLLRQQTDQAFVMDFDLLSNIAQPWTSDTVALIAGIRNRRVAVAGAPRIGGTVMFSAIYQSCLNQFGRINHAASGNFILLFSDGEDNASRTSLKEAVDMCRRTNTPSTRFTRSPNSGWTDRKHWRTWPPRLGDASSSTTTLNLNYTKICALSWPISAINIAWSTSRLS